MREIIQYPHPPLLTVSKPVERIDDHVREIATELIAIIKAPLPLLTVGMSAVQIGEPLRIIAIVFQPESPEFRRIAIIINPEVVKASGQMTTSTECCLSIGRGRVEYRVKRHKMVKVRGLDIDGKPVVYKERDRTAYALQHEIDHLDGILVNRVGRGTL